MYELIARLIQINPYTAYGKGRTTSKRNIKGKGERKDVSFGEAFDTGAAFRSEEGYAKFKKKRRRLYSDEEVSASEDEKPVRKKPKAEHEVTSNQSEEDEGAPISEYKSVPIVEDESGASLEEDEELTPMEVMTRIGRRAPGAVYIMGDDDWAAYRQYKKEHPEYSYAR